MSNNSKYSIPQTQREFANIISENVDEFLCSEICRTCSDQAHCDYDGCPFYADCSKHETYESAQASIMNCAGEITQTIYPMWRMNGRGGKHEKA